ncbi:MAG: hypothetical protein HW402_644 [Dehalococcoidales bacterium]|nr:hypothetical protein [Dehalococcoidales bacterium]
MTESLLDGYFILANDQASPQVRHIMTFGGETNQSFLVRCGIIYQMVTNVARRKLEDLMYLTRAGIARLKLVRAICLLVFIAIVLLIGATPVSAVAMDGAGGCPPTHGQAKASVPLCCVTPDCPLAHSITANVLPSHNHLTLSKVVHIRLTANQLTESSFDRKRLSQRDTPQAILRPPGDGYRCRNSLNSEEPPPI